MPLTLGLVSEDRPIALILPKRKMSQVKDEKKEFSIGTQELVDRGRGHQGDVGHRTRVLLLIGMMQLKRL